MGIHVGLIFFLLIILPLSSCNKSSYEKYAECASKDKNRLKTMSKCVSNNTVKLYDTSLNGTGSVRLTTMNTEHTILNKTDKYYYQ